MKPDMDQLLDIMARLRDPQAGCPWDLQQTFGSILPYTIEEAYEVADAIQRKDMADLRDELGDLLFQVVFYAQMANEQGSFDFQQVVSAICEKMLRRHPHVFGDAEVADAEEQSRVWEQHKAEERADRSAAERHSLLGGVARALPALTRGEKLQKRAAKVGFDWPEPAGALAKVREELEEVCEEMEAGSDRGRLRQELGDLLFSCVNLARHLGVDAESAMREANDKFEQRFRRLEQRFEEMGERLVDASADQLDMVWEQVKGGGSDSEQ